MKQIVVAFLALRCHSDLDRSLKMYLQGEVWHRVIKSCLCKCEVFCLFFLISLFRCFSERKCTDHFIRNWAAQGLNLDCIAVTDITGWRRSLASDGNGSACQEVPLLCIFDISYLNSECSYYFGLRMTCCYLHAPDYINLIMSFTCSRRRETLRT